MPSAKKLTVRAHTSPEAPWGWKLDGTPRKKPGTKAGSASAKRPRPKRAPRPKNPSEKRGRNRIDRGGFKADGTPMPPTHDVHGRIIKGMGSVVGKLGGRPKGSISMDRLIRRELGHVIAKGKNKGKTNGEVLIETYIKQAMKSGQQRGSFTRFLTERMDGKAVQPIKDVTRRSPLADVDDKLLDALLAHKRLGPDKVPQKNLDRSSPQGRGPAHSQPASARSKPKRKKAKRSGKR